MNHISLFSGIGGFDLAAEWMGWENIAHCEWNPFGQRVLKHYWPNAISYHDITKTDFTIHRGTIDILTGGFPCQPYSMAGKRKGKEDERHLWPEMLRAIREIAPRWVVGENVGGLINWNGGMVFDEVQSDLEAEGYEVQPFLLPACGLNAPHRRDRIWFVAYAAGNGTASLRCGNSDEGGGQAAILQKNEGWESEAVQPAGLRLLHRDAANTEGNRDRRGLRPMESKDGSEWQPKEHGQKNDKLRDNGTKRNVANTRSTGLQGGTEFRSIGSGRQKRHKQPAGHLCTDWQEFPTQSPVCDGDDGLSIRLDGITFSKWRNESIKAGGNAIVPQVALEIFKAIQEYELREKQQTP